MPVTAKLSKELYNRLDERVANELVEWFNSVDLTYRSDLRELNELNYARFESKLEQRLSELDAKLSQRITELEAKLDRSIAELRAHLDARLFDAAKWFIIAWVTQTAAILGLWVVR